ncbi:MAG: hypothetical protein LBK61_08205 [Spirochaetaceae bacterium]|jgi:hypothetical protein|nr:hypothetical protein [Spirochaetaceae bacterium]
MRRHLSIIAALAVSCVAISCVFEEEAAGVDTVKPPVVLQLTVTNSMDAPIDVQIRHRYKKGFDEGVITTSDPVECTIPVGDSKILGDETVVYREDGVETTMAGFVLMDDERNRYFGSKDGDSSFELKVTAGDTVIQLAGYESESPCFNETRLCDLWLVIDFLGGRGLVLFHKPTNTMYGLDEPTLLTASLLINADGTYVFDMEPPF